MKMCFGNLPMKMMVQVNKPVWAQLLAQKYLSMQAAGDQPVNSAHIAYSALLSKLTMLTYRLTNVPATQYITNMFTHSDQTELITLSAAYL